MSRYFVEHLGVWAGIGMMLIIAGMLIHLEYFENMEIPSEKLTLGIVGILFGFIMARTYDLQLLIKKLKDKEKVS